MAWIVYANLAGGNEPAVNTLDVQSTNLATFGVVPCTAAFSSNVYTLTPIMSGYTGPAYAALVSYVFRAGNASTGNVTLKVGSLAALNVYKLDGTTQVGNLDVISGQTYAVIYDANLNSSAGGWLMTPYGGVSERFLVLADNTTDDVSITKHGFAPKSPNDATRYLDGTGAYTVPAGSGGITLGTEQATTSGSTITFTGIAAGVKQITMNFVGVSTNGTANPVIQMGSGSLTTTGYVSSGTALVDAGPTIVTTTSTSGFLVPSASAAITLYGTVIMMLEKSSTNQWIASGTLGNGTGGALSLSLTGKIALSGAVDRVALVTTDTFDAGALNITYQ